MLSIHSFPTVPRSNHPVIKQRSPQAWSIRAGSEWLLTGCRSSVARALATKARCPGFDSRRCHFLFSHMLFSQSMDSNNADCVLFNKSPSRFSDVAPSIRPGYVMLSILPFLCTHMHLHASAISLPIRQLKIFQTSSCRLPTDSLHSVVSPLVLVPQTHSWGS